MSCTLHNEVINLEIDACLKREATELANNLGLSLSEVLRIFLIKFVSEKQFPFIPDTPNKETISAIEEAKKSGLKSYDNVDDFFKEVGL